MFYSTQILGKKGPLATIWLAAHMERKLKKEQWLNTSVADSVDTIITPEGPLALRLVGQLLLGVVRIHSLKINHLLGECSHAVQQLDQVVPPPGHNLLRTTDHNLVALPKDLDEIEFFQQAARELDIQGFDASAPFSTEADDNSLIFLTDEPLDHFQLGTQDEMFEAVRDEEMEQLLLSPEKLRDAGRSPSVRRAFEELRAASVASKTPTQSGRRERSHSSQGQGEEQALPPEEDMLNVPQPSPAPLMQDPPDLDMDEAPPMDDGLLGGNLEGLDAMLPTPTPTPSGKSGSRSAGRTRGGTTPRSKAGSLSKQAAARLDPSQSSPGPSGAPDLSQPEDPRPVAGTLRHAKPPRPRRARAQVDKDIRVPSRAGQGTAGLVRRPARLTRAALLGQGLPNAVDAEGGRLQHLAVSDVMAPALLALYNRACCQARATPRKRAPAGASDAQPAPWSAVEERAQQQALPGPGSADQPSAEAEPMQDDYAPPDTWEAEPGTGNMPPDPFAGSQAQQLDSPQQAHEASGQDPLSQLSGSRSRMSLGSPGSLGPIPSSEGHSAADRGSMTARSRRVLSHLEALFHAESSKRRRTQAGALRQPGTALLSPIVEGKTRVDASRWFFELLVLKSQGHVGLQQADAYGDVAISSTAQATPSTAAL